MGTWPPAPYPPRSSYARPPSPPWSSFSLRRLLLLFAIRLGLPVVPALLPATLGRLLLRRLLLSRLPLLLILPVRLGLRFEVPQYRIAYIRADRRKELEVIRISGPAMGELPNVLAEAIAIRYRDAGVIRNRESPDTLHPIEWGGSFIQ